MRMNAARIFFSFGLALWIVNGPTALALSIQSGISDYRVFQRDDAQRFEGLGVEQRDES